MMTHRELLANAYAFFNARAIDSLLEMLDPDVDWPNGMEGGRVHGHTGVRDYWTRQWNMIDPHVEPIDFATEKDGSIRVTVHQTVRELSGKLLVDQVVEHVYRIELGLIQNMEIREHENSRIDG